MTGHLFSPSMFSGWMIREKAFISPTVCNVVYQKMLFCVKEAFLCIMCVHLHGCARADTYLEQRDDMAQSHKHKHDANGFMQINSS